MKEMVKKPIFFERNRVFRVYKGGYLFGDLMGDKKEDNNYPEEWIASTVTAINDKSENPIEGLSIVEGTGKTFKEFIEKFPKEILGDKMNLEILVKYLDSAIRLPLQTHPNKEFSEKYFNSTYGKTEMWLILAIREDASICFGFSELLTKEEFSEIIEKSRYEKDIMNSYLYKASVKPGEVYLIPAKAVHAIGEGCLILEVQEPTDFTIQPEYWCGDYLLNQQEMYMGLEKEVALECFDYKIYGKKGFQLAKKEAKIKLETDDYLEESLITKEDTPCFVVDRYVIKKKMTLKSGGAIHIITNGKGIINGADYCRSVNKGEYFFLPFCASGQYTISSKDNFKLELVVCDSPK